MKQTQDTGTSTAENSYTNTQPTVYFVDDDPVENMLIERICDRSMLSVQSFNDGNVFIQLAKGLPATEHGCVILDVRMPNIDGLETFQQLREMGFALPVIFFTGVSDVELCRDALMQGAFDFVSKDSPERKVLSAIRNAIAFNLTRLNSTTIADAYQMRRKLLTGKEHEVMNLLAKGATLNEIAKELKILPQTASKHRGSVFRKMEVGNEVQLVKLIHGLDMD